MTGTTISHRNLLHHQLSFLTSVVEGAIPTISSRVGTVSYEQSGIQEGGKEQDASQPGDIEWNSNDWYNTIVVVYVVIINNVLSTNMQCHLSLN